MARSIRARINVVLGFGFIFLSGFALLPALIVVLITEAFYIRSVLAYAMGGAIVGAACYLGLIPFDPETMRFDGIVRRHLEIMTGAGIVAGLIYWMIAGRSAGAWREPRPPLRPPPPLPSHSAAAGDRSETSGLLRFARNDGGFHPQPPRLNPAP